MIKQYIRYCKVNLMVDILSEYSKRKQNHCLVGVLANKIQLNLATKATLRHNSMYRGEKKRTERTVKKYKEKQ